MSITYEQAVEKLNEALLPHAKALGIEDSSRPTGEKP
jgi:hypothetical protein